MRFTMACLTLIALLLCAAPCLAQPAEAAPQADAVSVDTDAVSADTDAPRQSDSESLPLFGDEEDESAEEKLPTAMPPLGSVLLRLVGSLALILVLLVAGLYVAQKVSRKNLNWGGANRPLRIIDKLPLGPKKYLFLTNLCGRYVILGVTDKGIDLLLEVTPAGEGEESVENFSGLLEKAAQAQEDGKKDSK